MPVIENQYITTIGSQGDGLTLFEKPEHFTINNCIIDLSHYDIDNIDEALGVSWGCSADITNSIFRGAGKLVLCGSGDKDKLHLEQGKKVTFTNCILEDFSRRGPEVQDGMQVFMKNCLIQNWCSPDRFSVRGFAGWAHTEDSYIQAENCVFLQKKLFNGNFFKDLIGHIGQAINDGGIFKIFTKEAWQPGTCRALVATDGGEVEAIHCYKNHWWMSIQNHDDPMDKDEAEELINNLENMRNNLLSQLKK